MMTCYIDAEKTKGAEGGAVERRPAQTDVTRMPRRMAKTPEPHAAIARDHAGPASASGQAGAPNPEGADEVPTLTITRIDTALRELKTDEQRLTFALEKRLGSAAHQAAHESTQEQTALYQARCTSNPHRDLARCVVKMTCNAELARNEWDHLITTRSSVFPTPFVMGRVEESPSAGPTRYVIVMEFVHGETLSALMEKGFGEDAGSAPVEKALEIISPLASAFRDLALSLHPFVHRDVKPDNIIVSQLGGKRRTRLIDLGVSSHVGDPRQREHLGYSALYAAPEIARPETYPAHETFSIDDARIDTYGLAATLHALLLGSPPKTPLSLGAAQLRHDAEIIREIKQLTAENVRAKHGIEPDPKTLDQLAAAVIREHDDALLRALERGLAPLQSQRPTPTEFFDMLPTNYRAHVAGDIHLRFLEQLASKSSPAAGPLNTVRLAEAESVDLHGTALDDAYRYPAFHEDFHHASMLYNSGNYQEAVPLLMKLTEAGDAVSSYNLGVCYKDGLGGLKRDERKMLACWMRAADGGHIVAIHNVGVCHEEGRGVPNTPEMKAAARIWYERAAALGFPAAIERLASL